MSLKDAYVEKLKVQLDEWSADIDVLEAKVRQADAELRIKYDEQVIVLKEKRDEAKVKLAEVQSSAGEAWQELKKGSDEAWETIKHAFAEARKKFGE
ncbi:hypothetical protein LG201_04890 [Methylobacillus gramineus]|uniref:hypothetical protein n=1 Tax=Methylobacillus gramineus TaxID=755169 RepID=UPI001CFF99FD|nr:hypothetical protein [Methylobacillus gramineus]MCB5184535.1 hypothetical protein [Methylobacillus gramineus]